MTTAVLFGKKGAKIGVLQLDATVSEDHNYENEVTQYPVENGSTIGDNIRLLPERITIQGLVSNTPVNVLYQDVTDIVDGDSNEGEAWRVSRDDTPTRVESAQNILLRMQGRVIQGQVKAPELVEVVTGLRVYKNMALVGLKIPRTRQTGKALAFTADFLEVKTAEVAFIDAEILKPQPAVADKASNKIQKGKQTPRATTDAEEKQVSTAKEFARKVQKFTSKAENNPFHVGTF